MQPPQHVPVLLEECLDLLKVRRGGTYADATLGLGGHSAAIARLLGGAGTLIAFDRDPDAMAEAQKRLAALAEELGPEMPAVRYVSRPFSAMAEEIKPGTLDGLLADFGVSSLQLDQPHRGFSFRAEGPLDMRMDPRGELSAHQVENRQSHCEGPADPHHGRTCQGSFGRGPRNERRKDSSGDQDISSPPHSCQQ